MEEELQEARENAYSIESRNPEEDGYERLSLVGIVQGTDRIYRFYKGNETGNYWYESRKK